MPITKNIKAKLDDNEFSARVFVDLQKIVWHGLS